MALYMISYDLHLHRDYQPVYELMAEWQARRLLESLWLAELRGPAETVRDILAQRLDADDSIAVIEIKPGAQWGSRLAQPDGIAWLRHHLPAAF